MGTIKTLRLRWATHQQQWWGKWHLYLGIISGLIVAVVGVTGSILVFQDEIDRSLNPSLFIVLEKQRKIPLEEIIPMVKKNNPQLQFDYILNDDDKPNHAYYLYNFATEEQVFINPYTAEISGKRLYESGFIHWVTEIHRTILIPVAGRYIVGIASLILLILTITGLRLWIPQKWRQLKSVLSVKFSGSFKRQNYDWHNVLGFYSSPVIALLSLTGFCITFSFIIVPLLFILSGKSPQDVEGVLGAKSIYSNGAVQLPIEKIAAIGKEILPEDRIAGIAFPGDSIGNFRLDMAAPGLPKSGNREMLLIDQYSGKVLLNSRTDFPNVGNAYLSWLTPIHYGSFGGRPTQVIALIGGLIPLLLFITGFIIWWPRYKKQKRQKDKTIHFVKEKSC
ncbi:MAG: PepSY-associated TM helix domain-containing protein [Bacteroidota bacterium]